MMNTSPQSWNRKTEQEPLTLETSHHYWTFHDSQHKRHLYDSFYYLTTNFSSSTTSRQWMFLSLFLVVGVFSSSSWNRHHHAADPDTNHNFLPEKSENHQKEWMVWDHNVYHPSSSDTDSSSILLAQHDDDSRITELTSLPNRAYARQHGMDYVRFRDDLFSSFLPLQSSYDAIAFFPSHAMLIHLDLSFQEVLPTKDQIMTLGNTTEFFVLNLLHADTIRIMAEWRRNDDHEDTVASLRSFVVSQVPHTMTSYLPEQPPDGFVGTNRLLQCLPRREESSSSSFQEYQMTLSTTVASVCYRYYPQCEVIL